jgi:hypothetical protein
MLGGGGIIGNQRDFFIETVGMLYYFELIFSHERKKLGSIKWQYKKLACMVNGLHGFFSYKKVGNPFYIYVNELANMSRFLYNMW